MTKAYWTKELDTWTLPLKEILKTPYMDKLMNFVTMQYSLNSMLPNRDKLFEHFRNCKYDNVFVVVTVPCISHLSNIGRITFDEEIYDYEYGPLKTVSRQIELEYHNGFLLDFDYTLKHWGEQGILVLPQSFTYVKLGQSHQVQWNKFFHYILQVFNENKPGTIFLQWGTDLDLPKHNSLKFESPVEQFKRNKDWKFPFKKVDEKIKQLNNLEIQW
jgi:uracil DNA glycosylase